MSKEDNDLFSTNSNFLSGWVATFVKSFVSTHKYADLELFHNRVCKIRIGADQKSPQILEKKHFIPNFHSGWVQNSFVGRNLTKNPYKTCFTKTFRDAAIMFRQQSFSQNMWNCVIFVIVSQYQWHPSHVIILFVLLVNQDHMSDHRTSKSNIWSSSCNHVIWYDHVIGQWWYLIIWSPNSAKLWSTSTRQI